jgi:Tol biopolymer transport system component
VYRRGRTEGRRCGRSVSNCAELAQSARILRCRRKSPYDPPFGCHERTSHAQDRTLSALTVLAVGSIGTGTALAATAGQTFLAGGLPLPAGAIAGAPGGYAADSATTIGSSANGRYVAFASDADTLAPGLQPDVTNIFRKDRQTGAVVLVSRASGVLGAVAQRSGVDPQVSADGNRIAWRTTAALAPADTDGGDYDVYVRDVAAATTLLASQGSGGAQTLEDVWDFDLSANGQFAAFESEDALAGAADGNGVSDIYRRDLAGGTTALMSSNSGGASAANAASYDPALSGDGRWVAFASSATDVVAGYSGGGRQVFARDLSGGRHLVSNQSGALTTASNGEASEPDIAGTPNGTLANVRIAYTSNATNAGADDGDSDASVYRRQLSESFSRLVSRATTATGANADSRAHTPSISDDGERIAFSSDAGNLGAGADYYGAYVRDLAGSTTVLGSTQNAYSVQATLSGDGSLIMWFEGQGLTPDVDRDIAGVYARTYAPPAALGSAQHISRPAGAAPFLAPAFRIEPSGPGQTVMSGDGRYLVFKAYSSRLPGQVPGFEGQGQVFRRDTRTGALDLVSRAGGVNGAPAGGFSQQPAISADGTRVAFATSAKLSPSDTDSLQSVYVRDLVASTTTLVSRAAGAGGANADATAGRARISGDGRHVLFTSSAGNLGVPGGTTHLFKRSLDSHALAVVDRANGAGGTPGNGSVTSPSLSHDGRIAAFASTATNLDPADAPPDLLTDVYVRDTVAGTTRLASRRSGATGQKSTGSSTDPALSADGRWIAFSAADQTLAPEAGPWGNPQIVARSLATHANTLVSRAPGGAPANDTARDPNISRDGSVVAFDASATNLLPGRGGASRPAVFARTMATGALSGPPAFGLISNTPNNRAAYPSLSPDGQCMAFSALGHNAIAGAAGDYDTAYVYVVSGSCPKPTPLAVASKPTLRRVSMKSKRFRVTKQRTARIAAKRKRRKAPAGTAFRFTLDVRANVTIRIHRQLAGRKVGRACRRPAPRLRGHKRCKRYALAGGLSRRGLAAGRRSVKFSGRIGRKALKPGRYRATLYAANSAGRSKSVKLAFRVVRR